VKLLVCGGRDYSDYNAFLLVMDQLPFRPSIIIEGGATGADRMGRRWGIQNGVHYATVPALWDVFNNAAGPIRNSAMLILNPDYCLAALVQPIWSASVNNTISPFGSLTVDHDVTIT